MDLCVDARMAHFSGIGTCIRQLVPHFNQPPFRLTLLVDRENQPWCHGIKQILVPAPIYTLTEQLALPFKIPPCDLFWSPHYNIPLLPIRAKKRIVTIHDVCHLAMPSFFSRPRRVCARFVMRRALRSDAIVTVSGFSQKELLHHVGHSKNEIHIIPNGVDRTHFQPIIQPHLLKKYNLPKSFILFVGNAKPHKNLAGLLKAFSGVPQLHLVAIIGQSAQIYEQLSHRVTIVETVPDEDLPGLYSLAQMLVFPSLYEGFGFPPLEAMSCGCPTIVSNRASLPEICGDASFYVDPLRPQEICHAIQTMINNHTLRQKLIQRGLDRVKMFDWAQSAQSYRALFLA
jgi:glycosyltransferase involved in cell wall biosynthesis